MSLLERIRRIEQQHQRDRSRDRSQGARIPQEEVPGEESRAQKRSTRSTSRSRDFTRELRLLLEKVEGEHQQAQESEAEMPPREEPSIPEEAPPAGPSPSTEPPDEEPPDEDYPEEGRPFEFTWESATEDSSPEHQDWNQDEDSSPSPPMEVDEETLTDLRWRIHKRLIETMPSHLLEADYVQESVQREVHRLIRKLLDQEARSLPESQRERLFSEVIDEVYGLGPIEEFMRDPEVTEIMVNGPHQIYIERHGLLEKTSKQFQDEEHLMRVIQRIIAPLSRRLDEANPMVDGRLPDGSRINAVIPPISLVGPVLTVHKFYKQDFTVEDLLQLGSLNEAIVEFLKACVTSRQDILICGGTSTGKTTMLNVLSSFIPEHERLITIEDAAELRLNQEHVITLEARPPGIAGRGEVSIRDIVRNALRMRPDRIIIGEVRGGEALDMLQAMNTGHEGSMCTIHANSPADMLSRLETMVMMAGMDLPERTIREQITSAIDIIVHMGRLPDGTRKVLRVSEVWGMEGDQIVLQDIFVYRRTGIDERGRIQGRFEHTGVTPQFWDIYYPNRDVAG